jgi:hypothetical protein
MEYHIYIDESRYLKNDKYKYMVIGGIWVSNDSIPKIKADIKEIKKKHSLRGEIKWTHVSPSSLNFYTEIINYFFNSLELNFRCVTVNKTNLSTNTPYQDFYYKVCYQLLITKIRHDSNYRIFLDYKDKYNTDKILTLKKCLTNSLLDIEKEIITDINTIRSESSIFIQLCDLLIGAIGYKRNELETSDSKLAVINHILKKTNRVNFRNDSPLKEEKFNVFNMFDKRRWINSR